ncbi:tyrosine-type recombinase/integrase [Candidatus Parcubacteria bacterium]|nr:tyrosine-type recombinase/integrase [Candidatus Parcubacteria bacterium]
MEEKDKKLIKTSQQKPIIEYLNDFLDWLDIEKGLSFKTQENYARFLKKFFEWLKLEKLENLKPAELSPEHIFKYKVFLSRGKKTLKKTTQACYLIALRQFLTFFAEKDILSLPPEKIKLPKETEKKIHFLNLDQVKKLLEAPNTSDIVGLRDRAILEVLFSTGMRVGELVKLTKDQIKIEPQTKDLEITIIGKGERPRTVYFSERAIFWLREYLKTRQDKERALFISYRGKTPGAPITIRSVERMIKKYATLAGLPPNTVCHTLRHSFATDLLQKGVDVRLVQEFLGHKSIVTTQIYTHITKPQLKKIHQKYHGFREEKENPHQS